MRLEEFNKLSFNEKLYMVYDKGTFLDNYVTINIRLNCYAIDKFFVELVYCSKENKVLEVRSFDSGAVLDKYISLSKFKF